MLLKEINEHFANLIDVDFKDDLHFFMHNDSEFYRRILFPAIRILKSKIEQNTGENIKHFKTCVEKAIPMYCKKFKIKEIQILSPKEIDELAEKMYQEELTRIEQGVYKGNEQ